MTEPVPIRLYKNGVEIKGWHLYIWDYTRGQQVWGLWHHGPTHMSYRWPEDNVKNIVRRNNKCFEEDPAKNPDWLRWYFDVGAKIYVEFSDLIEACEKLGIWDEPTSSVHEAEK